MWIAKQQHTQFEHTVPVVDVSESLFKLAQDLGGCGPLHAPAIILHGSDIFEASVDLVDVGFHLVMPVGPQDDEGRPHPTVTHSGNSAPPHLQKWDIQKPLNSGKWTVPLCAGGVSSNNQEVELWSSGFVSSAQLSNLTLLIWFLWYHTGKKIHSGSTFRFHISAVERTVHINQIHEVNRKSERPFVSDFQIRIATRWETRLQQTTI